jgi:hypothetical protein
MIDLAKYLTQINLVMICTLIVSNRLSSEQIMNDFIADQNH